MLKILIIDFNYIVNSTFRVGIMYLFLLSFLRTGFIISTLFMLVLCTYFYFYSLYMHARMLEIF